MQVYKIVPGTASCLMDSMSRSKKWGKNDGMMSVRDTAYERMLATENEYVKIWKLLMDKYMKQTTYHKITISLVGHL